MILLWFVRLMSSTNGLAHTARISDKHYTEANETHYEMLRGLTETADYEASSIYKQSGMFSVLFSASIGTGRKHRYR